MPAWERIIQPRTLAMHARCDFGVCRTRRPTPFCGSETSPRDRTTGRGREGLGKKHQALNIFYATNELYHDSHHNASAMRTGGMGCPCLMVMKIRISRDFSITTGIYRALVE
jgi:hypothetical protein